MNSTFRRAVVDPRGSVMVEYVVVLCLVSLGAAVALAALGGPLLQMYLWQAAWLELSVP